MMELTSTQHPEITFSKREDKKPLCEIILWEQNARTVGVEYYKAQLIKISRHWGRTRNGQQYRAITTLR